MWFLCNYNNKKGLQMNLKAFVATVVLALSISTAAVAKCNGDQKQETHILALNMYHEARGEGEEGMRMVGETTLNRVASEEYPDTVCEVVYQSGQFSWVYHSDKTPHETELWSLALLIANDLMTDNKESYDHLATHFISAHLKEKPSWTRRLEKVGRVGNHIFYRM